MEIKRDERQGDGNRGAVEVVDERGDEQQGHQHPASRIRNGQEAGPRGVTGGRNAFWAHSAIPIRKIAAAYRNSREGQEEKAAARKHVCTTAPSRLPPPLARQDEPPRNALCRTSAFGVDPARGRQRNPAGAASQRAGRKIRSSPLHVGCGRQLLLERVTAATTRDPGG